jgi:hypothetical protein
MPLSLPAPTFPPAANSASAGAPKPARLPQLFYSEAHALRLIMDLLFRLVTEAHGQPDEAGAGASSELWTQEVRVPLSLDAAPATGAAAYSNDDALSIAESRLISLCESSMLEYVSKTKSGQLVSLECSDEVLVGLCSNFAAAPPHLFRRYLSRYYNSLCELIEYANAPSIRHAIRKLFMNNIGGLLTQHGVDIGAPSTAQQQQQ